MLNADPRTFRTSLTTSIKLVTYLVGWGLGMGLPILIAAEMISELHSWFPLVIPALMLLVLAGTYAYRPLGYLVTEQAVEISRPIGALSIPLADLISVKPVDRAHFGVMIGMFRSGGFYGIYGLFWSKRLGRVWVWMGNGKNMVELDLRNGQRVIISPDERERFLALLAEQGAPVQR